MFRLGDYNASGASLQQAIWLDDLPVGLLVNIQLHYIEPDRLGTSRMIIDPALVEGRQLSSGELLSFKAVVPDCLDEPWLFLEEIKPQLLDSQ